MAVGVEIWGEQQLPSGVCRRWKVGELTVWARRQGDEWQHAFLRGARDAADEGGRCDMGLPTADVTWERHVCATRDDRLLALPLLPDCPVLVRPETPLSLQPGASAVLFISLPTWFCLRPVGGPGEADLATIPVVTLSRTWFGSPVEGVACYALRTRALRGQPEERRYRNALCTMHVRNGSEVALRVERICVHVETLAVYGAANGLWTNVVRAVHRGGANLSELTVDAGPPAGATAPREWVPARAPARPGFVARTFHAIGLGA